MNHYHNLLISLLFMLPGCASDHYGVHRDDAVDLYLKHDAAQEVFFASSMDGFVPHRLTKNSGGMWVMQNLHEEEFIYFYLVDNRAYIPNCRYRQDDDFGGQSCVHQP